MAKKNRKASIYRVAVTIKVKMVLISYKMKKEIVDE